MFVRTLAVPRSSPKSRFVEIFTPVLVPGTRLDRYELVCPVGQGGMASVWVARLRGKRGFENLVAIKTILPQHAGDASFEQMFIDEARIVAGIRHQNVASVLDVGDTDGLLYLVFEFLHGEQLSALRRAVHDTGKDFDVGIALRVMADACAGLHAAHEQCDSSGAPLMIVHRDVSPQNIMVTTSGGVKVIDFGVAKALHRLGGETEAGIIKGKMSYLSPEMARGETADRRADVWAAGVVLFELLAGRLPIAGETRAATVMLIARGAQPASLPARIPSSVAAVVSQALASDPNERFQTAGEMHRALEGVLVREYGPVTGEDVAAYLGRHLGKQINERVRAIAGALETRLATRESMASVIDESYPSVSIGESSLSELGLSQEQAEAAQPGTVRQVPRKGRSRTRRRILVALPAVVASSLAVMAAAYVSRAPASPNVGSAGVEQLSSAARPAGSLPSPAESVAALATTESPPPDSGSTVPTSSVSAGGQSRPPMPKPPITPSPTRKSSDPRAIFGAKR